MAGLPLGGLQRRSVPISRFSRQAGWFFDGGVRGGISTSQGPGDGPVVPLDRWMAEAAQHEAAVRSKTADALARRTRGAQHPVEDFLFTYYRFSFASLREWHPPCGTSLEAPPVVPARFLKAPYVVSRGLIHAAPGFLTEGQLARLRWIRELLVATHARSGNFGCHGMHEWAMVYGGGEVRHGDSTPLRLGQGEIDAFVESRPIRCSHFDAFRFFAPAARAFNKLQPDLEGRVAHEQPGCIHANMDLYKWAGKAMPWVGSALWFEAFLLAGELRDLDMRASPYDLRAFGLEPVMIETPEGRAVYENEQRRLAEKSAGLRQRLIDALGFLDRAPDQAAVDKKTPTPA